MDPIRALYEQGQSVWYDHINRALIQSGELTRMIEENGLRGITSNPTIFEKAIAQSDDYDNAIAAIIQHTPDIPRQDLFFTLAIEDIQAAADAFLPVYHQADGHDGLVSLEVAPDLAYDTQATITEAHRLWGKVDRPNLMIKVPATREGLPAIEALISDGINVNATLLFAVERYREVVDAFISGLETRQRRGQKLEHIASVASFFVSRVDAAVDKKLTEISTPNAVRAAQMRGKVAIANAKLAYQSYNEMYSSERFAELSDSNARPQRLLWASTGTKSPEYSDVMYVDELIGPDTVNTMPPATYNAFLDHGAAKPTLETNVDEAIGQIAILKEFDINLDDVTRILEEEGVKSFAQSFDNLLAAITHKANNIGQKIHAHG